MGCWGRGVQTKDLSKSKYLYFSLESTESNAATIIKSNFSLQDETETSERRDIG